MSWTTYKATIAAVIDSKGYRLIPENKAVDNAPESFSHKGYSLKWSGMADIDENFTGNAIAYTHIVDIEVQYINGYDSTRDINAELFQTLVKAIANMIGFKGFRGDAKFEDKKDDPKKSVGTISFLFGVESC